MDVVIMESPGYVQDFFSFYIASLQVDELAEMVVRENGKTMSEARGEVRRGIDMIEYACGIPSLLMGRTLPDVRSVGRALLYNYSTPLCVRMFECYPSLLQPQR
jgi:hypothetical protein